ncbi:rho family-interacting cell polarization regulator 2-like isoform X3 [Hypomesus transpacificus]|uniref:rho family-interacting cell polarization regulator 2-like isoform X3 n=1 Tax=Hypomesus transpacificus TaxID=137520 RepID=UPI001F087B57|nr:rho family-interacting cell polarization regulator 2-like isoform X3 [Hypomesus transpacificus]
MVLWVSLLCAALYGLRGHASTGSRMFTGSTKNPPPKSPQPERLDEVYAALRRGLQSYLQVHQLELDSLGQQIRESKRNGRLGFLYELDKQVKAIERFMRHLEFHLSKVEELYDAYCLQRRLRDGASKMVAAFNSASNSKEARESLSEATRGYREYTEHMCSLECELEGQMGEFNIKMKGLAGFARLCAGDQYEVLMRFGRQRWRLRGRVEVGSRQVWDSEEYVFLPLVTEMLSIKVTELKSLANHVVVGSVSCETLELFCPLPQTVAVDINNLGTVKLNLEVTWSPFDKDDQTSSASTVSKRFLSNQSPPDTPSMREQVFYSLLKRQGELENGTVWSNSSESSDDSSSPAMGHQAHRMMASHTLQTTPTIQISFTPRQSSSSNPSLSSNQEDEVCDSAEGSGEVDSGKWAMPNGILQCSRSLCNINETGKDSTLTERPLAQTSSSSLTREKAGQTHPEASCFVLKPEALDLSECGALSDLVPASAIQIAIDAAAELEAAAKVEVDVKSGTSNSAVTVELREGLSPKDDHQSIQSQELGKELRQPEDILTGRSHSRSSSFSQEVETALESFDFLNCSDMDDEEEEERVLDQEAEQSENYSESRSDCDGVEELEIFMEAPEGFRNCDCSPIEDDCSSPTQVDYTEHLKASIQEEPKEENQSEENGHEEEDGKEVNHKDRDDEKEVEEEPEQEPGEECQQKSGEAVEEEQKEEGAQEEEKEQKEKMQEQEEEMQEGKEEEHLTKLAGEEASCDEETQPSTSTHLATTALQP